MKNPWIIIGVLVLVLFGGAIWYSNVMSERANEGVEITENVKGNPDADVVLVEYSDFQCPACGSFYPVVKEILADHGDEIRFEYRHFPLMRIHPLAEPAARAAEAAGQQGKFWEYHDALFENQDTWAGAGGGAAYFAQIAQDLELDMQEFARHQRSSLIREKIQSDLSEGVAMGVDSTPSFFLNGQRVQLQTMNDLRAAVEAELGVTAESAGATTTDQAGTSSAPTTEAPGTPPVKFGF